MEFPHQDISKAIIGAAFEVHNVLGYGFLERVYRGALKVELENQGYTAHEEVPICVFYKGVEVGFYKPDLIVNGCIVVELKIASEYNSLRTHKSHFQRFVF